MGKVKISGLDEKFWGLVVYDMEEDGCLHGRWSNTGVLNKQMDEIARKTKEIKDIKEKEKINFPILKDLDKNEQ